MNEDIYPCPVCEKPFDMNGKLADFALAAHEKERRTMKPERLLIRREGVWVCTQCGEPFGGSKDMAWIAMVSHMKEHGIRPVSSVPDATRSGEGVRTSLGGQLADLAEDVIEAVGTAIDKVLGRNSD